MSTLTQAFFLLCSIFTRFRELDPKHIPLVMTGDESHTLTVPMEKIEKMPELKVNARTSTIIFTRLQPCFHVLYNISRKIHSGEESAQSFLMTEVAT